ncbi:MAG: DNA-methyltransferase [Phycisphaerae bacterium]
MSPPSHTDVSHGPDGLEVPQQVIPLPDQVTQADNLEFMATLPVASCHLIYIDPPFGTGQSRRAASGGLGFVDPTWGSVGAWLDWMQPRFETMHRLVSANGSLVVHLDWRTVHYAKTALDSIFGGDNFLNEIIWSYRTGGRSTRWFARKHDTLLLYAKAKGCHAFNVLRDGTFRTLGMNRDADGRPYKSTRNGRLYFHPDGPALTDVWDLPFLSTVSAERNGYPTQKPEALLDRVIRACSNPGDVVADFFCGSGTTLAVAKRLGRRAVGCDLNPQAVELTRQRLAGLDGAATQPVSTKT